MPKHKRNHRDGGLSEREFDDTTTPIINELERAAIRTPLVNPALRQLASGGISTARPGREAVFDVLSTTAQTIERLLAASRTSAGRALGVRPPRPKATTTSGGSDVAAAIAAANAAAAAATSAAMAAQAAATMMASMVAGRGEAGPAYASATADAVDTAGASGAPQPPPMVLPSFPRLTGASIASPLVRSRADLGTGRMRQRHQIRQGAALHVPLTVTNGANRAQKGLTLRSSDLISSRGHRIPSDAVRFSPPRMDLAPKGRAIVTATISVPAGAPAGSYTARIYGPNHEGVETTLTVNVR